MRTFKPNTLLLLLLLLCTATAFSQHKKLDKTYNTGKDVKINVDARHTNVIFETWDRNEVQISAYVDGKMNATEAKNILDGWKIETSGNSNQVTINSGGGMNMVPEMDMAAMTESLGQLQNLIAPIMNELVAPMMENLAKHPPLPPDFAARMGNLNFDYEAYQRDGDKYMKQWEKKVEKNFGKDFEKSMEQWAAQFEKNAAEWEKNVEREMETNSKSFEASMEKWGESFGASMEKWGESFGAHMEQWGEQFAREMEAHENREEAKVINVKNNSKANRFIKVKMPVGARLHLDVRHGEVNLGNRTTNLQANLSHSKLSANVIDGEGTNVKVSYSPVTVSQWNYGVLNTSYVQNCVINKARSIKLVSNSSDVNIREIEETGILSGTFGELKIGKLHPNFRNLDISLKNSDLELSLPQAALNFNYNGTQSNIEYPKASTIKSTSSYDNQMLNGFYGSGNGNRNVSINASFSDIIIK